jgi:hypothetical protein
MQAVPVVVEEFPNVCLPPPRRQQRAQKRTSREVREVPVTSVSPTRGKTQRHDAKEKPRRGTSGGMGAGAFPGVMINQQ